MENNILIEPSLQKKINQNDIKIRLLLNKGFLHNNIDNIDSIQNDHKGIEKTNSEIKIKDDNELIKNIKKIMKFKIEKEEKKCKTKFFRTINNNEKFEKKEKIKFKKNNLNKAINSSYKNDNKIKKIIKAEENKKEKKDKINKTFSNCDKIKDNFFERQKFFMERKEQKREQLKEKIKKEEEKLQSAPSYKVKKDIIDYLNHFKKWEKERIEKIEKMKKEKEEKIENEFDYIPKIDENSLKIVEKNELRKKQPNTFLRLSEQDKILKEKKKILIDMYTPSFKPFCYEPKNLNLKNIQKKINITEIAIERNENSDEDSYEEKENKEEESEEKLDEFDYQQDIMIYTGKEVENVVRNSIFHHKNNK